METAGSPTVLTGSGVAGWGWGREKGRGVSGEPSVWVRAFEGVGTVPVAGGGMGSTETMPWGTSPRSSSTAPGRVDVEAVAVAAAVAVAVTAVVPVVVAVGVGVASMRRTL